MNHGLIVRGKLATNGIPRSALHTAIGRIRECGSFCVIANQVEHMAA